MGKGTLKANTVLSRLEKQRNLLGMTRFDVSVQTGIPYSTITNTFHRHKIPMFNDLYLLSIDLGIPVDDLLADEEPDYTGNKNNILYWKGLYNHSAFEDSLLFRTPDKVAIAKTLNALSQDIDFIQALRFPIIGQKDIDQLCFMIFYYFLTIGDPDSLFIFQLMGNPIKELFYVRTDKTPTLYDCFMAENLLPVSLWGYPYMAVQNLWMVIDENIPHHYPNKSMFLKEASLNSQTYNKYLMASIEQSTPGTETAYRACRLLGINDIDSAIRSKLPEIPERSVTTGVDFGILPHTLENSIIAENLKTLPYMAMFFDGLFVVNYDSLADISVQICSALNNPYSRLRYNSHLSSDNDTADMLLSPTVMKGILHPDIELDYYSRRYPGNNDLIIPVKPIRGRVNNAKLDIRSPIPDDDK